VQTQIICPSTGASLSFDIPSDEESIARMWDRPLRIACPVCNGVHETGFRQVYVTGLMDQFQCLPADFKEERFH
jgi:hypothetical protein